MESSIYIVIYWFGLCQLTSIYTCSIIKVAIANKMSPMPTFSLVFRIYMRILYMPNLLCLPTMAAHTPKI